MIYETDASGFVPIADCHGNATGPLAGEHNRRTAIRIEPLYDRIIVREIEGAQRTPSGLHIPEMAIDGTAWRKGEVIATGQGRLMADGSTVPLRVKEGDVVVFLRNAGSGEQVYFPLEDGTEAICIREPNVIGILRGLEKVSAVLGADGEPVRASA